VTRTAWLVLAVAMNAHAGVTIEGTVALRAPAPPPAAKPRYAVTASYVIGPPDPPAAVVFLEGAGDAAPVAERVVMAQRQYQFAPGLLAVRRGTRVEFPNFDDEYHSVFSYSRAKRFDLGRYHKDERPAAIRFDEPGVVKLYCEIHDHMRGTILVLDTPYFTKTDAEGRFRLTEVPAGEFVLKAWLADDVVLERAVTVQDGGILRVDFGN
jgi:plastocyanin